MQDTRQFQVRNHRAPTNNAGNPEIHIEPGLGPFLRDTIGWFAEFYARPKDQGFFVADGLDKQRDPPQWMNDKDQTVLGQPITKAMRGDNWWENKYARELAIAQARLNSRDQEFTMELHDVIGTYRNIMRWFGMWPDPLTQDDFTRQGEEELERLKREEISQQEEMLKKNWRGFMKEAVETNKPLATVALKYRNVYDVYGLDQFLDKPVSLIWLNFKLGCFVGVMQGGWRALKLLHVDAHFLQVSGIGVLAFVNTSVIAGMIKWGGNFVVCSCMFALGDYLTWWGKFFKHNLINPYLPRSSKSLEEAAAMRAKILEEERRDMYYEQQLQMIKSGKGAAPNSTIASSTSTSSSSSDKKKSSSPSSSSSSSSLSKKKEGAEEDKQTAEEKETVLHDRLMRAELRLRQLQEKEAVKRSPINYCVGMSCAFGVAGLLPYWMLGDVALGLRYTAAGASVGGVLGWTVGMLINNLVAINLGRLDFTQHQFRSYQSLLKVEKLALEQEVERRKKLDEAIHEQKGGIELAHNPSGQ